MQDKLAKIFLCLADYILFGYYIALFCVSKVNLEIANDVLKKGQDNAIILTNIDAACE